MHSNNEIKFTLDLLNDSLWLQRGTPMLGSAPKTNSTFFLECVTYFNSNYVNHYLLFTFSVNLKMIYFKHSPSWMPRDTNERHLRGVFAFLWMGYQVIRRPSSIFMNGTQLRIFTTARVSFVETGLRMGCRFGSGWFFSFFFFFWWEKWIGI